MGRKQKTKRKAAYNHLANAVNGDPQWAGRWRTNWPLPAVESEQRLQAPLVLELGAGKAELSLALAQQHPDRLFLAQDVKADRLWKAAQLALEQDLKNFLCIRESAEALGQLFASRELDEIWLTFPDPYPKKRHARRRMVGRWFLAQYQKALKPGGWFKFKTDNQTLFEFGLLELDTLGWRPRRITHNLHRSPFLDDQNRHITFYEQQFMAEGLPIHYLEVQPPRTA